MAQPPTQQPNGRWGTQSYLIECNRATSKIDKDVPRNQNARWTTPSNFQLKRGDKVSVETLVVEGGESSTNATIEFTRQQVRGKAYCDSKVVFEFGFYINNNSRYNTLAPFRVNWKYGAKGYGEAGNLQQCATNSPQMPPLQGHIPGASVGFSHRRAKQYDVCLYLDPEGQSEQSVNLATHPLLTQIKYIAISHNAYQLLWGGVGPTPPLPAKPDLTWTDAQYNLTVDNFYPPQIPMASVSYPAWADSQTLTSEPLGFPLPVLPKSTGWDMTGFNFPITVGMGISIDTDTGISPYMIHTDGDIPLSELQTQFAQTLGGEYLDVPISTYQSGAGATLDITVSKTYLLWEPVASPALDPTQPPFGTEVTQFITQNVIGAVDGTYYNGASPELTITNGSGIGALFTKIVISGGECTEIWCTGGYFIGGAFNYVEGDTLSCPFPSNQTIVVQIEASQLSGGSITKMKINQPGSGYALGDFCYIDSSDVGSGLAWAEFKPLSDKIINVDTGAFISYKKQRTRRVLGVVSNIWSSNCSFKDNPVIYAARALWETTHDSNGKPWLDGNLIIELREPYQVTPTDNFPVHSGIIGFTQIGGWSTNEGRADSVQTNLNDFTQGGIASGWDKKAKGGMNIGALNWSAATTRAQLDLPRQGADRLEFDHPSPSPSVMDANTNREPSMSSLHNPQKFVVGLGNNNFAQYIANGAATTSYNPPPQDFPPSGTYKGWASPYPTCWTRTLGGATGWEIMRSCTDQLLMKPQECSQPITPVNGGNPGSLTKKGQELVWNQRLAENPNVPDPGTVQKFIDPAVIEQDVALGLGATYNALPTTSDGIGKGTTLKVHLNYTYINQNVFAEYNPVPTHELCGSSFTSWYQAGASRIQNATNGVYTDNDGIPFTTTGQGYGLKIGQLYVNGIGEVAAWIIMPEGATIDTAESSTIGSTAKNWLPGDIITIDPTWITTNFGASTTGQAQFILTEFDQTANQPVPFIQGGCVLNDTGSDAIGAQNLGTVSIDDAGEGYAVGDFIYVDKALFGANIPPDAVYGGGGKGLTIRVSENMLSGQGNIGIKTLNMMNYKDNAPYILVCPSHQGPQVNPNGTAISPDLTPMTAFVVVEATATFEAVSKLAETITQAFHAVNPFAALSGRDIGRSVEKRNNVLPYVSNGWFPTYWKYASTIYRKGAVASTPIEAIPTPQPENKNTDAAPFAFGGNLLPPATGYIEPGSDFYVQNLSPIQLSQNNGVQPIWSGSLIKCLPANCRIAPNFAETTDGAPYYWTPDMEIDYLSSGGASVTKAEQRGTFRWWNGIYGNMGVKDLAKHMAGDKLNKRSETWNLNCKSTATTGKYDGFNCDCGRIVILNTQLRTKIVKAVTPEGTNPVKYAYDPTMPHVTPEWDFPTPNFTEVLSVRLPTFRGALVTKNQAIMTNMYYNETNINLLKEVFKLNEQYETNAPDAVDGYEAQQAQPWNWFYEFDVGQSDDACQPSDMIGSAQTYKWADMTQPTTNSGYPPGNPNFIPQPSGVTNPLERLTRPPQYLLETVNGYWKEFPPPMAQSAPYPSSLKPYDFNNSSMFNPSDPAVPQGRGIGRIVAGMNNVINVLSGNGSTPVNPYPDNEAPFVLGRALNNEAGPIYEKTNISMCSPAQCTKANGWGRSYQEAKKTGIIRVYSRWFPELDTNTALPDFSLEAGNTMNQPNCNLSMINRAKDANGNWLIDPSISREAGVAACPYIYNTRDNGVVPPIPCKKHFISFMAFRGYEPFDNQKTTWTLNQFEWGDFIGFSPSCYDNPVLIPTNSDALKYTNELTYQSVNNVTDGKTIKPNPRQRWNQNNYVWCGAGNAVCEYDPNSNRFKIGGLYTETLLPELNEIQGNQGVAVPQIGEAIVSLNADQFSAKEKIWTEKNIGVPPFGPVHRTVTNPYNDNKAASFRTPGNRSSTWGANSTFGVGEPSLQPTPPTALPSATCLPPYPIDQYDKKDQGINDVQTGVFLHKIWLAPEGWEPPPNINLQNYYNPTLKYEKDPTINMGNRETTIGGPTTVPGTKYTDMTAVNKALITENLVEASLDNWTGCLLDKMGFDFFDLMPPYGKQDNRFSEFTYGRTDITTMYEGTKPLIQNSQADTAANLNMSIFSGTAPSALLGTPLFSEGFLNNETINIGNLNRGEVTAARFPVLFSCPFYSIISNIVETQFQSNDANKNVVFVGLKNYNAGQYYYCSAGDYSQEIDVDRTLTEISTEIRNPNTGRLAQLQGNSCIIYKIQRQFFIPNPEIGVNGELLDPAAIQAAEKDDNTKNTHQIHHEIGNYIPEDTKGAQEAGEVNKLLSKEEFAVAERGHIASTLETQEEKAQRVFSEKIKQQIESVTSPYTMDREDFMKAVYKLVVEKVLEELPVRTRGRELLNPYAISIALNDAVGEVAEWIAHARAEQDAAKHGEAEGITDEQILRELRTKDVYLGRGSKGPVKRRKPLPEGRYTFDKSLVDHLSLALEKGVDVKELKKILDQAIVDKTIGVSGPKGAAEREELYKHRQALWEEERRKGRLRYAMTPKTGTTAEQNKAALMARRWVKERSEGAGYTHEEIEKEIIMEVKQARRNPVAYMKRVYEEQRNYGGGGGGDDTPPKERLKQLNTLQDKIDLEKRRGAKQGEDRDRIKRYTKKETQKKDI